MIVHLVLFEPKADLGERQRQAILEEVRRAATSIPSVRRCRIGVRMRHGLPGYEQAMSTAYGYAAIFEFDDRAGLIAYLHHPLHEAVGRHFAASAERALAYDYEVEDAAEVDAATFSRR